MESTRFNFKPVIALSATLLLFPLFATVLSGFVPGFSALLALSLFLAVVGACPLYSGRRFLLEVSNADRLVLLVSPFVLTFVFYLRLNWHLFDLICPTALLNMVSQVARGIFPVSFMSFPEFPANYHQGFVVLSGALSFLGLFSPYEAMHFCYLVCFFLSVVLFQLYAFSSTISRRWVLLLTLGFFFSTSFPSPNLFTAGKSFIDYLSVFEYISSNSWALGTPLLLLLALYLKQWTYGVKSLLGLALMVLSASTINATLFSALLMTAAVFLAYYAIEALLWKERRISHLQFSVGFLLILGLWWISRFIVSAFLRGDAYDVVHLEPHFLHPKYVRNMGGYLFLLGPLGLIGLVTALQNFKKASPYFKAVILFLLVSFGFPVVFKFSDINAWDNLHKFVLLSLIGSGVLLVHKRPILRVTARTSLCVVSFLFLLTVPSLFDMVSHRFRFIRYPEEKIASANRDLVTWLRTEGRDTVLLPYGEVDLWPCSDLGEIGCAGGNFIRLLYFEGFLLSKEIERRNRTDSIWWKADETFREKVSSFQARDYLICRKEKVSELNAHFSRAFPGAKLERLEFKNFILMRRVSPKTEG